MIEINNKRDLLGCGVKWPGVEKFFVVFELAGNGFNIRDPGRTIFVTFTELCNFSLVAKASLDLKIIDSFAGAKIDVPDFDAYYTKMEASIMDKGVEKTEQDQDSNGITFDADAEWKRFGRRSIGRGFEKSDNTFAVCVGFSDEEIVIARTLNTCYALLFLNRGEMLRDYKPVMKQIRPITPVRTEIPRTSMHQARTWSGQRLLDKQANSFWMVDQSEIGEYCTSMYAAYMEGNEWQEMLKMCRDPKQYLESIRNKEKDEGLEAAFVVTKLDKLKEANQNPDFKITLIDSTINAEWDGVIKPMNSASLIKYSLIKRESCQASKFDLEFEFGKEDFYNRLAGLAREVKAVFELRGDTIYFWPQ